MHTLEHGHLVPRGMERGGMERGGAQEVRDGTLGVELVHDREQGHDELEHDGEVEHDEVQGHGVEQEHGKELVDILDRLLCPHRSLRLHSHHDGRHGS